MSNSFAQLKKTSKKSLNTLVEQSEKMKSGPRGDDGTEWYPKVDKSGNGTAVIRFLPAAPGDEIPWVRMFSHAFKGKGGWYIDLCATTIEADCPVCTRNTELWGTGKPEDKAVVQGTGKDNPGAKRQLKYVANVLIISDPSDKSNEGRVFKYKFGQKIFDKVQDAMAPEFEGDEPINPFDFWAGANLRLKIRNLDGYRNYNSSVFEAPSAVSEDDEELKKIWESQYSLSELIAPDKFKTFAEAKARLNRITGAAAPATTVEDQMQAPESSPMADETATGTAVEETPPWSDDDDDGMKAFQELADQAG